MTREEKIEYLDCTLAGRQQAINMRLILVKKLGGHPENYSTELLADLLFHPQPAEVSADKQAEKIMRKHEIPKLEPVHISFHVIKRAIKEALSLSPPPVRHMSDEEIDRQSKEKFPKWEDDYDTQQERRWWIEGNKAYRSFIQSQQPKQGLEQEDKWIIPEWALNTLLCPTCRKVLHTTPNVCSNPIHNFSKSKQPEAKLKMSAKDFLIEKKFTPNDVIRFSFAILLLDEYASQSQQQAGGIFSRADARQMIIDYVSKFTTGAYNDAFKKIIIGQATTWFDEKYPESK